MNTAQRAILQTVLYSDLFDYPLKPEELWFFLKSNQKISKQSVLSELKNIKYIVHHDGYYLLKNRKHIAQQRQDRETISKKKLLRAQRAVKLLSFIPSILFIGISGSLAMNNAKEEDDIDLFIIVKHDTVWTTRLLALLILELFHIRRSKQTTRTKDTVCLNMIIDENALAFSKDKHDVYIAHEIAQLKPLFDRSSTYQGLLTENSWIKNVMPNVRPPHPNPLPMGEGITATISSPSRERIKVRGFAIIESLTKKIQLRSINQTKTTEVVTDTLLAFHPTDNRHQTLLRYYKKLKNFLL